MKRRQTNLVARQFWLIRSLHNVLALLKSSTSIRSRARTIGSAEWRGRPASGQDDVLDDDRDDDVVDDHEGDEDVDDDDGNDERLAW